MSAHDWLHPCPGCLRATVADPGHHLCRACEGYQLNPVCIGCHRGPDEIREYTVEAEAEGVTPAQYVRENEGTYNRESGHFLCTMCYIDAGMPAAPGGWKAP